MMLVYRGLLLAYLAGGLRFIFLLLFLTAPHALAHPVAHVSCVTHRDESLQAKQVQLCCYSLHPALLAAGEGSRAAGSELAAPEPVRDSIRLQRCILLKAPLLYVRSQTS